MTVIVIGISFIIIWLVTTFFIIRSINKLKNDLLNKRSDTEKKPETQPEKQPEKSEDIPKDKTYKPFENINNVDPAHLLNFIQQEHPQVIALVLAHMKPNNAAIILQNLLYKTQNDVSRRIATMDKVSHEITREIERVLEKKLSAMENEGYSVAGGIESFAGILNFVDRASERQIIEAMEDEDPELAEEIKKRLFVFEDIVMLDDPSIKKVLRETDLRELAKALKTVDPEVQDKIFRNMSEHDAKTVKQDIEYMGPLRLMDADESQQKIISIIRHLEDKGEIKIERADLYV
jgi:flagellar motor switch protein FliG